MLVPLSQAVAGTCGGKAGALGVLLRAGLPVPDGFVVPFVVPFAGGAGEADEADELDALTRALARLGDPPVAVRSSAAGEDTGRASAAGQHESFLAVRGAGEVAEAVHACRASLFTPRAVAYRGAFGDAAPMMAVIVQRQVDAEASGVMFTPAEPGGVTDIEASWGLGPTVVGGTVTPDAYRVAADGTVARTVADKRTRLDRHGGRLVTREVPEPSRTRPALDDATALRLAELGGEIAAVLGGPQDIEFAIAGDRIWILQSRPITAPPPPPARSLPAHPSPAANGGGAVGGPGTVNGEGAANDHAIVNDQGAADDPGIANKPGAVNGPEVVLAGTPGSRGAATGVARIVRGPADFGRVRPGDILVCPFTDPAWTPLLRVAAGVVTEIGGVLSHAAIVAREHGIPAVLGVADATVRLDDGAPVTVDGATGTVTTR
ncbi:PEP/pyruvate-binding domain-containing protein [Nonomuraea sp. NPDC048826]|uniref:PEP/pyruvate-binding domain-containing protein n=1 Tax=Nonomuraea sp. NPDC048826 TaxID=3364347 RepID=UPI003719C9AB